MGKNYQLMQELERKILSRGQREPAFPTYGEDRNGRSLPQVVGDSIMGLVQRIFLQQMHEPPRLVVFAGIDHGNGCSSIAAGVAERLAENAPGGVCLVEANFRSPALPSMFGVPDCHGLTDALLNPGSIRSFITPVHEESLWLLCSGSSVSDSPRLLISEKMKLRVEELRAEFDFVIVDAPPLTRYSDAIALGQLSDGIVLILEAGSTRREVALTAVEHLRSSGVLILGAVLNKREFPIPEKIYQRV